MKWIIQAIILALCVITTPAYAQEVGEFIDKVLGNNPAIQAAESNVAAATARETAFGKPLYNPELTAETQSAIESTTSVGINQTIDWFNKRGAREQVGTASVSVARAQLADLRQRLAVQILGALAQYQAEEQAVLLAKERTVSLRQFVTITKKRYDSGDIARVDLDLAQLALAEGIAQQASAEVSLNQALQILRATTGFDEMNWPRLSSSLPTLKAKSINVDNLIEKLPAVAVLTQEYETAEARLRLAERERYPDPTIGIQGGESSDDGQSKALIGVSVSIPLFIRNSYRAEVNAANYDAMEADGKRADIVRQARAEISSSAERYQTLYYAAQQWEDAAGKPLSDGMTLIERLWQAGEISSTDYLVQLNQRIDSQIAGVALKGRAWEAWAQWLKASGQTESWLHIKPTIVKDDDKL